MKNKTFKFIGYFILLIGSIFLGYFLIIFSIFFFLGRQVDKEYNNGILITSFIIISFLILLFILLFSITKIIKILLNWREQKKQLGLR